MHRKHQEENLCHIQHAFIAPPCPGLHRTTPLTINFSPSALLQLDKPARQHVLHDACTPSFGCAPGVPDS